jgi:hypothetical protein
VVDALAARTVVLVLARVGEHLVEVEPARVLLDTGAVEIVAALGVEAPGQRAADQVDQHRRREGERRERQVGPLAQQERQARAVRKVGDLEGQPRAGVVLVRVSAAEVDHEVVVHEL